MVEEEEKARGAQSSSIKAMIDMVNVVNRSPPLDGKPCIVNRSLLRRMSNENVEEKTTHANVTLAKEANARAAAMKKRLESAKAALKGLNMTDKEQPNETVEAQRPEMSTKSELEK